jgi:hypothetical protein
LGREKKKGSCGYGPTLDGNLSRVEHKVLDIQDMAVVGDNDRHNRNTSLNSEVESALLERQQDRILCVAAGTLGKDVHTLTLGADLVGGTLHSLAGVL